jgi:glycosyltransferase involved in cell wall biosynthesis
VRGAADRDVALSVVVMGYRNRGTIVRAVKSIVEQVSPEPFEVIVVTSGGDDSAELVRSAFPQVPVVEASARLLPGGTRNTGIAATRGGVVAFLEGDCIAEQGWVAARLTAHRAGHPAVACSVSNGERWHPAAWAFHFDLYSGRLPGRAAGHVLAPDAASHGLSLDRRLLEQLGPFDEQVPIGEDTDMAQRLAVIGVDVWFEPAVRTAHLGPRDTVSMLRERYRRGLQVATLDSAALSPGVFALLRRWALRVRTTIALSWRYAGPDRWWVVVAVPWIMAARAAGLAGWHRGARRGASA